MIKEFIRDKIIMRNKMIGSFLHCINIELTNRCNLSCKMCPHSSMSDFGDMDFELFKKVIDQCSEFADEKTTFFLAGLGEPLLYPNLLEAIDYIKLVCPRSHISFATNGILLNEENVQMLPYFLDEHDGILISINTNSREEYKQLMGADKYEQVKNNIQTILTIKNRRVPFVVQFLDTRNGEGIEEFKKYWEPQLTNKDRIFIRPLVNWNGKIDMSSFVAQGEKERYPCLALWTSVSIDRHGNIYPCCESFASHNLRFGNIKNNPLIEAYSNNIKGIRNMHIRSWWNVLTCCSKCDMWKASPNTWIKLGNRWY